MKENLILSTVLLFLTNFLYGQDFGALGTQWYYSEHGNGAAPPNSEYIYYESTKDTVIAGHSTHKISRTFYRHTGAILTLNPIYVYEQTDTVFIYSFERSKFLSIYIFNGQAGDTLTLDILEPMLWTSDSTYRLLIDTVETKVVDGISLKKYRTLALDDFQFHGGGYFMDKIGGLDWFFTRPVIIPEAGGPIRCYSDIQIDTSFQSIACDFRIINSLNEIDDNSLCYVFPNPFRSELNIQSKEEIEKLELHDYMGKRIVSTNQTTLNLENIDIGVYILSIYLKSGQRLEKKVIKNTF